MNRFFPIAFLLSLLLLILLNVGTSHAQSQMPTATASPAPQTIMVTNLNGYGPGSLIQAIIDAKSGNTINFAPTVTGILEPTGSLAIYKDLTINGPTNKSASLVIPLQVVVVSGHNLNINNLTLQAGIFVSNKSKVNINGVTFENSRNGAIANDEGEVTVQNSTFIHNWLDTSANSNISNNGIMIIKNSTIIGNIVDGRGYPYVYDTPWIIGNANYIVISNSTIVSNNENILNAERPHSQAVLTNTILVGNLNVLSCFDAGRQSSDNIITDNGGNLRFQINSCSPTIPTGDPKLGNLQDNGGPTWTMALLPGSAAINKGIRCQTTDQRGAFLTTQKSPELCDAGAFQTSATFQALSPR